MAYWDQRGCGNASRRDASSVSLQPLASLNLFANPPRVAVPIHYVFGEQDALSSAALVEQSPAAIGPAGSTTALVPQAGHMVHFDQPEVVRAIAVRAIESHPLA